MSAARFRSPALALFSILALGCGSDPAGPSAPTTGEVEVTVRFNREPIEGAAVLHTDPTVRCSPRPPAMRTGKPCSTSPTAT